MPQRMRELLGLAAKAFRGGEDIAGSEFLLANNITAAEQVELEHCIAAILDWYLLNSK